MAKSTKKNEIVIESKESDDGFPLDLPLLPLRDVVLFPDMIIPILVIRESSVEGLQKALMQDRYLFLTLQKNPEVDEPVREDLYQTGVVGRALQVLKLPNGTAKVLIEGVARAVIQDFREDERHFRVTIEEEVSNVPDSPRLQALLRNVNGSFADYVKLSRSIPDEVLLNISQIDDPLRLANTIAAHLLIKNDEKQQLLEFVQVDDLLSAISKRLASEIEILELEKTIDDEVKERLQKSQKDYYLHEQMRVIREELGEEETDSDIYELEDRIKKAGMSREAVKKANEELKKLQRMHIMSPESTVVRSYLDWLLSIPWKKRTRDNLDIEKARIILDEDHYGLEEAKDRILEYLAVLKLSKSMKGPILCFTGPPGTGKTSLGKSVARAIGRNFIRMSLGGIRDEAEIRGHRRTYIGSMPGRIIQNMKKAGTRNPVFLLDEIDKLGMDFRGDPSSALLEVLDPEQNNSFNDNYLEVDYDLSEVMFITTSNYEGSIPPPLLDRMEIIRLSGYLEFEKVGIAERHLIPKTMDACGLKKKHLEFDSEAILQIIRNYTAEAGVRNLERTLSKICRKVASEIVSKKKLKKKVITKRNIGKYLGIAKFRDKRIERSNQIGMAVGLAWTPVGGEILNIETSLMPGKGELILTGHLGDVMKESARAALTYAKANREKLGIPEEAFEKTDVHIHVPEGAIKKDGPSAGVAMLTSLVSAASGRSILRTVAMTGEITLRGNVLAIGGLKEKTLAAKRSGIKMVIIPKENEPTLKELPEGITSHLDFVLASTVEEVLEHALTKQ